jgi:hypothetical protein
VDGTSRRQKALRITEEQQLFLERNAKEETETTFLRYRQEMRIRVLQLGFRTS